MGHCHTSVSLFGAVKFFGWLMVQERLKCRHNLKIKNIVEDESCPICNAAPETTNHLILDCVFARAVWQPMGFDVSAHELAQLWELLKPDQVPLLHYNVLLLLICWALWEHRNDVVFNASEPSLGVSCHRPRTWLGCGVSDYPLKMKMQ
jgi:hypothetical protein